MDKEKARLAFDKAIEVDKQEFGNFFLTRMFGLDIQYTENQCLIELDAKDFMFNPQGTLHGGVISFIMDVSMGHLLNHACGPGVTIELKVQFVKAVKEGKVSVKGEFIKKGRSICFLRSEVRDSEEALIAFATSTWKLLH